MAWTTYLVFALLVAACIPVLDVIATWYYLRFAKGVSVFRLLIPWAAPPTPNGDRLPAAVPQAALATEGGRAHAEPSTHGPSSAGGLTITADIDPGAKT